MNKKIMTVIFFIFIFFIIFNREKIRIFILNNLIVLRGILTPNCNWYKVSDLLLTDGTGVKLYNKYKQKYGDFFPTKMFGVKLYVVTNNKYIETILYNSPNLFSVGKLKKHFFKSFMNKNVGVSSGCPWKRRRRINDYALNVDKLHKYSNKYHNDVKEEIKKWKNKYEFNYTDFSNFGKIMVAKIVFNTNHIDDEFFKIFSEANSIDIFERSKFKIDKKIHNNYVQILNKHINKPNKNSLVELCLKISNNKEEVFHQLPHFIFPMVGLFAISVPRLLLLLCNHKNIFKKVIQEINSTNEDDKINEKIYKLTFLRKCILETLRLNNPVITTFRTLNEDYTFDNKHSFKKGTQFVILNNPVLRENEYFKQPNKFNPYRWTSEMEKSTYAISFNQGPQKCPGKELSIYLIQNFVYNFIKNIDIKCIESNKIDTNNIPQIINPCNIKFTIK